MARIDLFFGGIMVVGFGANAMVGGNYAGALLVIGGILIAFGAIERSNA